MLKVAIFFFFELAERAISKSALDYKDFVNPTRCGSWNCCSTWCRGYMYQFLDEQDMWSLVEKNPKVTGVLEKHNTKVSLWREINSKNHVSSIRAVSTLLAIWKIKPNEKEKQHKIGANWMEFQQSMSYNF
jgi:hypothetical protein